MKRFGKTVLGAFKRVTRSSSKRPYRSTSSYYTDPRWSPSTEEESPEIEEVEEEVEEEEEEQEEEQHEEGGAHQCWVF